MTGIVTDYVGRSSGLIKAASVGGGSWTKIKELTASASATLSFVDGTSDVVFDSTYPIYVFKFINIHPATDSTVFQFQCSTDGGSNYNTTMTSTFFRSAHDEADSTTVFGQDTGSDQAQGTAFQGLNVTIGNDNDQCGVGMFTLYAPADTTHVKHFNFRGVNDNSGEYAADAFAAGYFNTTSAIDAIQFKLASGNIDTGKIKMYGLKDS